MATFFELLGVTHPDDASARWPQDRVQPDTGELSPDSETGFPELMTYLQSALSFTALRPGVAQPGLDPDEPVTVGLTAELHVKPPPGPPGPTIVLAQMPKIGYRLEATHDVPAHLFLTEGPGGTEVAVHGLPVTIVLPPGLVMPKRTIEEQEEADGAPMPDVRVAPPPPPLGPIEGFDANHPDSLEIVLSDEGPSRLRVRINVRMTELGDFYVDPVVPISFGDCLLSGLPMTGVHDLQMIPQPTPDGVPAEHVDAELPLEWKRHRLDMLPGNGIGGVLTLRTLDLDMAAPPWRLLADKLKARSEADPVEFVIEDLAIPILRFIAQPLPLHGRAGLRRQVLAGDAGGENYNLEDAPVDLDVGPLVVRLFRILLQTTDFEGETPIAFDAVIQRKGDDTLVPPNERWAFPLSFTDDGVLTFGVVLPEDSRPRAFTVFGREIRFAGARLGMSLAAVKSLVEGGGSAADAFIALVDLEMRAVVSPSEKPGPATIESKTGNETSSYLEGLGWRLGKPEFGAAYNPTDLQLKLFKKFDLDIEEIGFVTEDNGGFYFSVSARLEKAFGPAKDKDEDAPEPQTAHGPCARTSAGRAEAMQRGFGLHLHRLRTRIGGNEDAPRFLLDGLTLFVTIGRVEISGFGALSEFDLGGNHYEEMAFGLQVCFPAVGRQWDLGFLMYRGRVTGVDEFTYWMLAAVIGGIPLGSAELSGFRALVARNLAPRLPSADGTDQPMRLYRWYKENLDAVELPQHRAMTAWAPTDQSLAWGAAATVTFAGTKAVRLHGFFFWMDSPGEKGFLAGLEVYALKAKKALAFAAFEWDDTRDKWGLTIGFCVSTTDLFDKVPDWLGALTLSGLLFFGNKPDTIAIGQYNDTTTWPSIRLNLTRLWKLEVFVGFCYHRVDAADALDPTTESIRVFGAIVSAKGSVKFGIGTFKVYFTLSWVSGQWRNEAVSTGHVLVIEAGIRIRLFGCFNFGASIKVDHAVLGPGDAQYRRTSTVIRIETPWWLPDVTVRWEYTSGTPVPELMEVFSRPLVRAAAIGPGPRLAVPIGAAGVDDEAAPVVFTLDQARALPTPAVRDADFAPLALVGCDSEIALDFKPSLDASATVLPPTPAGAGRQDSNELSVTYELVSVGIRRRRRYGNVAGAWADLIDPLTTELEPLFGLPSSQWQAHFQSAVGFDWDADVQRIDRLDPRRLLINAITPYSFLTGNPEGDEVIAETQPGWPCCTPTRQKPVWHVVDFKDTPAGARTPATEPFTLSSSTLHWIGPRPPLVVPPGAAPAGFQVARVPLDEYGEGVVATARFDQPARICEVHVYWSAAHSHAHLLVEGYRGLERVVSRVFEMSAEDPGVPIRFDEPLGLTSLLLRKVGRPTASGDKGAFVELVMIRYRTLRDERQAEVDRVRCEAREDQVHGQGRLAWLPNTDYEITVRTRAVLGYTRTGEQDAFVEQKAFFRTKGLPGLNAVARVGEELEPYVESVYPPPGTTLYRTESLALAFSERFNILAPIDRTPTASDPAERQTMMRWGLTIEKVGGDGLVRVSQTGEDWIVAHRTLSLPPLRRAALLDAVMAAPLRRAVSREPLRARLDRMISRPGGCDESEATVHTSQVLVHAPHEPDRPDAAHSRWEAGCEYRAHLRLENGPFIDRAPFVAEDVGALSTRTESGGGAPWTFDAGAVRGPGADAAGGPQYAVFGEADWDHLQIVAGIDPEGSAVGVAAGVHLNLAGAVARALVAWVDERGGARVRVEARDGGDVIESREGLLPEGTPRPFVLEVTLYDDVFRAGVAGTEVELHRGGFREGRMALVAQDGGRVTRVTVTALDGYRFHFTGSRYDDFQAHIGSHDGTYGVVRPGDLGSPLTTVAALLSETDAELAEAIAAGDAGNRDRLFTRWVSELALPLRSDPRRLEITRYEVGSGTDLLMVEGPEPLPLGGDVSLVVRKRRRILPPFPRPVPPLHVQPLPRPLPSAHATVTLAQEVGAWAEDLDFETGDDLGLALPLPPALARARRLVRAEAGEGGELTYHVYEVRRPRRPGGPVGLMRMEVHHGSASDPVLRDLVAGDVALLDERNRHLFPPFPAPLTYTYVDMPVRTLTDATGRRSLVIPVGADPAAHAALKAGVYRLVFSIDRPRWRAQIPDAVSAYRASVTLVASW